MDVLDWFLFDDEMTLIARGLVQTRREGPDFYAVRFLSGLVERETPQATGLLISWPDARSEAAQVFPSLRGVLLKCPVGRLRPGDWVTPDWPDGKMFTAMC